SGAMAASTGIKGKTGVDDDDDDSDNDGRSVTLLLHRATGSACESGDGAKVIPPLVPTIILSDIHADIPALSAEVPIIPPIASKAEVAAVASSA
nr:hypothetical protein [Tanacetum cinerariifolium]